MSSCEEHISEDEVLWRNTDVDMQALQNIVSSHFRSACQRITRMNEGAYARVFLFTLQSGLQVVGRIVLPVRESVKTEAEVATMGFVRGNHIP